jgi:hypothetical protein
MINKAALGLLGVSIATAAAWLAFEPAPAERAAAPVGAASVSPPKDQPEDVRRSSRPRPAEVDDARRNVAQAVTAGMVDALGDAKMRLRDHAAESELARQTPRQPPNGVELPTPEELARIREIRRNYGDGDLLGEEETNDDETIEK